MRWRNLLLSSLLAASVGLGFVSSASADPPPWAGRWKHNKHYDGDHDHWKHDHWNHDHDWGRYHRWGNGNGRDDTAWRYREDRYWRWRRDNDGWRNRDHDWWRDGRYGRYNNGYGYNGYRGNSYSAACNARIARDQQKIDELGRSGRHHKALRWFRDDLNNAMRDGC